MIDLKKQYRTEAGYEVKLSFIDGKEVYGYYKSKEGYWCAGKWSVDEGEHSSGITDEYDLVKVVKVTPRKHIKRTVWLNVYEDNTYIHSRRDLADMNTRDNRIACVKVEIDCKEGKGL
jgi:hypothetical protein